MNEKPPPRRVLYVTADGLLDTSFASQAMGLFGALDKKGIEACVVAFELPHRLATERLRGAMGRVRERLGRGRLVVLPRLPNLGEWTFVPSEWALGLASRRLRGLAQGPVAIVGRGHTGARLALRLRGRLAGRPRVAADLRGVPEEKTLYPDANRLVAALATRRLQSAKRMEREACRGADVVLAVSNALRDHLIAEYPRMEAAKFRVVPCCADLERFGPDPRARGQVRADLGVGNAASVFVHAGGVGRWHVPHVLFDFLATVHAHHQESFSLILTPSPAQARVAAERAGVRAARLRVLAVPHAEVPRFLAASDVALLLREDDLVNRVACPIKFAEYVGAGLPVVTSRRLGDVGPLVESEGTGWTLEGIGTAEDRAALARRLDPEEIGRKKRALAGSGLARRFSWDRYADGIVEALFRH